MLIQRDFLDRVAIILRGGYREPVIVLDLESCANNTLLNRGVIDATEAAKGLCSRNLPRQEKHQQHLAAALGSGKYRWWGKR